MDQYEARKYRKAKREGYKQGEANGIKIGEANGIKIGEANGIKNTAIRMMRSGAFSDLQIIEATGLTKEELVKIKLQDVS